MNDLSRCQPATPAAQETETLARETVDGYRQLVECYVGNYECSLQEAVSKLQEGQPGEIAERLAQRPPAEIGWHDLHQLSKHDPEVALQRWEQMKQTALDELQCGHRAALALDNLGETAWRRAQFLALRHELMQDWQPRNGIERQLIDTMAEAQTVMLFWLGRLTPRNLDAEDNEQAAGMVERFNRIFLRTLRALRDLRRHPLAVIVANAEQVNVGGQQVNVAGGGDTGLQQ